METSPESNCSQCAAAASKLSPIHTTLWQKPLFASCRNSAGQSEKIKVRNSSKASLLEVVRCICPPRKPILFKEVYSYRQLRLIRTCVIRIFVQTGQIGRSWSLPIHIIPIHVILILSYPDIDVGPSVRIKQSCLYIQVAA